MLNTFRYTVLELIRIPGIVVWSLLFPLVLSSVFIFMFTPLDEMSGSVTLPIVAVEPADDADGQAFRAFLDAMAAEDAGAGEAPLFSIRYAATAQEALDLVQGSLGQDDPFVGYVQLQDGVPRAHVVGTSSSSTTGNLHASILVRAMDEYASRSALVKELLASNPGALADPAVARSIMEPVSATVKVSLTKDAPRETVRYYFALMGMAALFGGNVGLFAFQRLRPNASALGARRAVGGLGHGRAVAATILGSWCVCFLCLVVTYLFMRLAAGIDFGGRDAQCLVTVAVASLTATALGCVVSALPHASSSAKSGILTTIVCFASLFAGLYGQPTMDLADTIALNAPWAEWLNPAAQISQAFYSITYYDELGPLLGHLAVLLAMAALFFLLSANSLRRHRYASL